MSRRGWIIGILISLMLAVGIVIAAPAGAHTTKELDAWVQRWEVQLHWHGGITQDLFMDRWDMATRHPCYFWNDCPPPRVTHTHPVRTYAEGVEQWRTLITQYFPTEVNTALRIIACESRGNPNAKSPISTAAGLWQFLRSTWDRAAGATGSPSYSAGGPYDPVWATINASWLRARGSGWRQWECY